MYAQIGKYVDEWNWRHEHDNNPRPLDGGSSDAGGRLDGGGESDGGGNPDGGIATDGGAASSDGGVPSDGGSPSDGGAPAGPRLYADFDPAALTNEINERYVSPTLAAQRLFTNHPYLTRLYTTLSPVEMTDNPVFSFNRNLPPSPPSAPARSPAPAAAAAAHCSRPRASSCRRRP